MPAWPGRPLPGLTRPRRLCLHALAEVGHGFGSMRRRSPVVRGRHTASGGARIVLRTPIWCRNPMERLEVEIEINAASGRSRLLEAPKDETQRSKGHDDEPLLRYGK